MKFTIKPGTVKKNVEEEKPAEDILFSMFDEEEAAEEVADAEIQSNKAPDDYVLEFISDFSDPIDV